MKTQSIKLLLTLLVVGQQTLSFGQANPSYWNPDQDILAINHDKTWVHYSGLNINNNKEGDRWQVYHQSNKDFTINFIDYDCQGCGYKGHSVLKFIPFGQSIFHTPLTLEKDLNFGTTTRQMINLWSTSYGIGVQSNTAYFRSNKNFAWFRGGVHNDIELNSGAGTVDMVLTNGWLGLGANNTSPTSTLDVNGTADISGTLDVGGNISGMTLTANDYITIGPFVGGSPGTSSEWLTYSNTQGVRVGAGNDNAFFGLKNRGGESGLPDEFNTVIYFGGDNTVDKLVFESKGNGELIDISADGVLRNKHVEIMPEMITGDGQGDNTGLLLKDNDFIEVRSDAVLLSSPIKGSTRKWDADGVLQSENHPSSHVSFIDPIYISTQDVGLVVSGKIRAKDIDVTPNAEVVPDYVFERGYSLKSIEEVNRYIQKEGHLPEVPSASEIGENGYALSDMDMTLLKKIEELTLYMIEANEQLKKSESRIEQLESIVKRLEKKQ